MACQTNIQQTIEASIEKTLLEKLGSVDAVVFKPVADKTVKYLNTLWDFDIMRSYQYSSGGGYKVVTDAKKLELAAAKHYNIQLKAEERFSKTLPFFNGDIALMEQAQREDELNDEYLANNKNVLYQKIGEESLIASEKTIRDLAATMSDRIGIPVVFESDRTKNYKGKIENNKAYVNLAYATLDTPIHEILGHPIIRAIKNRKYSDGGSIDRYNDVMSEFLDKNPNATREEAIAYADKKVGNNQTDLYQNLLKELETGRGAEVLDRIKRDYNVKESLQEEKQLDNIYEKNGKYYFFDEYAGNSGEDGEIEITKERYLELTQKRKYTLEEQQEEALVELLGLMTANKLDAVKDGKLISLLKRLLKEINSFIKGLLNQKEVEIDKLPDNITLEDLSNLLAYSNSKLILPGNEVIYTTPDNQTFKTYQEASNHISGLAKNVKDVDLDKIKINTFQGLIGQKDKTNNKIVKSFVKNEADYEYGTPAYYEITYEDSTEKIIGVYDLDQHFDSENLIDYIQQFIEKNKEYEQSKEVIDEWKKVNNIVYNPEEIYSRGQEFSSVVGAYSNFDVNLMMQNLLSHIEDNEKAGGTFAISAYTKPIDKKIGHLEGGGGKIKFKIYPQSKDILWAANADVYSGSVWDASEKVNKDKKSELLGVSYTKYPSLRYLNSIQPNLASVVDDLIHHHNELGITLTGNNFRLEYDEDIPYPTKKIINGINAILDQKYGKLVKPEISKKQVKKVYDVRSKYGLQEQNFNSEKEARVYIDKLNNQYSYSQEEYDNFRIVAREVSGIQPTQTKDNLKESIDSVKSKIIYNTDIYNKEIGDLAIKIDELIKEYWETNDPKLNNQIIELKEKREGLFAKKLISSTKNEYTNQALINTKIAKLKEVSKKYPRTLIRSEVKPISYNNTDLGFEEDFDLPFQLIPSKNRSDQETQNTPLFSESNSLAEKQKERTKQEEELDSIVKEFLKKAGVTVEIVEKLKTKQGLDANGLADILNNLIKISKGAPVEVLTEEAAHFLVEMLGDNHPLVRQMMDMIETTTIYQQVLDSSYAAEYNNDVELLKKEAVGKLIAQYAASNFTNTNQDPVGVFNKLASLIKKLFKVLTNKFTRINQKEFEAQVFGKAANMILKGDVSSLSKPTSATTLYNISDKAFVISKGFPMQVSNLEKLQFGEKRFTVRPRFHQEGVYKFGDYYYEITLPRKEKSKISDFKDAAFIKKTSIGKDAEVKYEHIQEFYDDKRSMFVYQIKKLDSTLQMAYREIDEAGPVIPTTGSKTIDTYVERAMRSIANLKKQKVAGDDVKNSEIDRKINGLQKYIDSLIETRDVAIIEEKAKKELDKLKKRLADFDNMSDNEMESFYTVALEHLAGWSDITKLIEYESDEANVAINNISGEASRLLNELYEKYKYSYLPKKFASNPVTIEQVLASPKDTKFFSSRLLDINLSSIPIIRKIGELLDRASFTAYQLSLDSANTTKEKDDKLKAWAKKNGLNNTQLWDLFQQKNDAGKNTGYYIHEIKAEYYTEYYSRYNKAIKGEIKWKEFYAWLNKNTNSTINNEKFERAKEQAKYDAIDNNGNFKVDDYNAWLQDNNLEDGKKRYLYTEHEAKPEIWGDSRFNKILNTPELKEYYDYFVETLEDRMRSLPVSNQRSKYYIPELKKGLLFDLSKMNSTSIMNGMGKTFMEYFTTDPTGSISYEGRDPITGKPIKTIPVYMMSDKLDPSLKNTDLSNVLNAFTTMSYAYQEKSAVEGPIRIMKDVFSTIKETDPNDSKDMFGKTIETLNANKNTIEQLEYSIDSVLYGNNKALPQVKRRVTVMGEEREVSVEHGIDKLISFTRMKGMGLNIFSGVTNLIFGLSANLIYSSAGTEFTESQAITALGIVMNPRNNAKIDAILKEYNILENITDTALEDPGVVKKGINKVLYIFQEKTERLNLAMTTVAIMLNTDVNGKNLWETYSLDKNKNLIGDPSYHSLSENKYKLYAKIKETNKSIHGNYEENSPLLVNKTAWGRALMVFRRWLPMLIYERVGSEKYNDRLERSTKGRWLSYGAAYKKGGITNIASGMVKELISQLSFRTYNYDMSNTVDNQLDIANMRKNVAEIKFILAFTILTMLLKGIEVPDDDDEKQALMKFIINQSMRLETDLTFFYSPSEVGKIFQNISPVIKTLQDIEEVTYAGYELAFGEDEILSGYNKGRSRFVRELGQLLPVTSTAQRLYELKNLNLESKYTR